MEYIQMTLDDWARLKQSIEDDLRSLSEGFVRVGYKLRQVRDQELYKHDGYETIAEWARAEYGLNASTVSRFIAINQKYSVDGNSDRLRPEFGKLGQSKLAEMLTLPDSDLQMVEPAMSRDGIRELKQFNKQAPDRGVADDLYELIEKFWEDNPDLKGDLLRGGIIEDVDEAKETVNPSGNRTYRKGLYFMAMYEGNIQIKKFGGVPDSIDWGEFFRISRLIFDEQAEEDARKAEQDVQKPQETAQKPQETAQEPEESVREEPEETEYEEAKGGELEEAETADDGSGPDPAVEDPEPAAVDPGESIGQVSEAGREGSGEEQEDEGQGAEADGEDDQDDGWKDLPETAEVIAPAQTNGVEASIHIILENLQKAVNVKAYKSALSSAENLVDQLKKLVEGGDQ